jgi:hypothetical protein
MKYFKLLKNLESNQVGGAKSLWIEENFFSKKDFNDILNYCSNCSLKNDDRSQNRYTLCLSPVKHSFIYDKIYKNQNFINFINSIKDDGVRIKEKPSYPIEYRKYFTGSEGMGWHLDTSLFDPDAFEIVLTLTNTSDSKFKWKENLFYEKSISPKPNTLAVVRPRSVLHKVSKVNYGERTILKFIIEFIKDGKEDNIQKGSFSEELKKCPF